MNKALIVLTISILCAGCTNQHTEVTKSGLSQAFILNSSPTFQGYYYQGSDATHHYFRSQWRYGRDKFFKVSIKDLTLSRIQNRDGNEVRLSLFSSGGSAPVLFEINRRKIYQNAD